MRELERWEPAQDHMDAVVGWHTAHGRHALALTAVEDSIKKEKGQPDKDLVARRAPLLQKLGWSHLETRAANLLLRSFPPTTYPLFK